MENKRGFTFVELLAIVVISGFLCAVVFFGCMKAVNYRELAECTDNLEKLGRTVQLYAQDYGGWVPVSGGWRAEGMWQMQETFAMEGYLRDMDSWACPSIAPYSYDRFQPARTYAPIRFRESWAPRVVILPARMKYALELARDPETDQWDPGSGGQSFLSLNRIREPADYFVIVERSHKAGYQHAVWGREHTSTRLHMRHGDLTNMLFADGGVAGVNVGKVEELGFESAWSYDFDLLEFQEKSAGRRH